METKIDLVVFGTFGTPNGFTQSSVLRKTYKTFDLNTNAIVLFPKTKIYSIRKEGLDGNNVISYSLYTFAKEKHSERGGTFIGSNISFFNKIANENLTINSLNEFHQALISNELNINNDIIQVNHSNKIKVNEPKDIGKIDFNLRQIEDLDFVQFSNKSLVVYSEVTTNKLQKLFKESIDLLNSYDTIYFTGSKDVAEFVLQKGLFKLVKSDGFEQEIKYLEIERKRKVELSIAEFEKEKENLEINRKIQIDDYNQQLETNERLHQENRRKIDESKKEVILIGEKYDDYKVKIEQAINQLKSGKKLEIVKQSQSESKRKFVESIHQNKSFNFLNAFEPKVQINLRTSSQHKRHEHENYNNRYNNSSSKKDKLNGFKIAFFSLLLLCIGTIIYFLFFNNNNMHLFI